MRRGFAQILPVVAISLLLVGGLFFVSAQKDNSRKAALGKVLSDKTSGDSSGQSGGDNSSGHGDSSSSPPSTSGESSTPEPSNSSSQDHSGSGDTQKQETQLEVHHEDNGKVATEFQQENHGNGFKVEVKAENGEVVAKIKDENGKEVEVTKKVKDQLETQTNDVLEKDDIKVATGSAEPGFTEHGKKVRTNFPLSVDPTTGKLYVTTPNGTKEVAVLPSDAIQNLIKSGVVTTVDEGGTPSPTPPSGTSSATTSASVLGASTELTTTSNGTLVYEIKGIKEKKLIGLIPVEVSLTAEVSAENGGLLSTQMSLFNRILDIFSF